MVPKCCAFEANEMRAQCTAVSCDSIDLTRTAFMCVSSFSLLQQTIAITLDPDHCGCGGRPGETETQALNSFFKHLGRKQKAKITGGVMVNGAHGSDAKTLNAALL